MKIPREVQNALFLALGFCLVSGLATFICDREDEKSRWEKVHHLCGCKFIEQFYADGQSYKYECRSGEQISYLSPGYVGEICRQGDPSK